MRSVRGGVGDCRSYQCREEGGRRANEGRAMFEEEERKKKKQRSAARLSAGVRRLIR